MNPFRDACLALVLGLPAVSGCCFGVPLEDEPVVAPQPAPQPAPQAQGVADVDATSLAAECSGPGCALVSEFAAAAPFGPCTTAQAVWLGEIHPIGTGEDRAAPFFIQVRPSATGGCEASARVLVGETEEEDADIERVLTALQSGQPLPPSGAVDYVRTAAPPSGLHPFRATAGSSSVIDGEHQYLRRSGTRLLMAEVGAPMAQYPQAAIDAPMVIGELWPIP